MPKEYWYKKGMELLQEIDQTVTGENMVALWFLGQESMVLKHKNIIIYIDPFFTDLLEDGISKRLFQPPFLPEEVYNAGWIICSHNHIDHLDPQTLKGISKASPNSTFIVPAPHVGILTSVGIEKSYVIGAKHNETLQLTDDFYVLPIAEAHEKYEVDENGNSTSLGYLIDMGGIRIFHSGDMVETEETADILYNLKPDILCLPINGADWQRRRKNIIGNINARDAANLAFESKADIIIPMHYDLFLDNGENPAIFVDYMHRMFPNKKYHIMASGERFIYMK